jgi:hypothetical protein
MLAQQAPFSVASIDCWCLQDWCVRVSLLLAGQIYWPAAGDSSLLCFRMARLFDCILVCKYVV